MSEVRCTPHTETGTPTMHYENKWTDVVKTRTIRQPCSWLTHGVHAYFTTNSDHCPCSARTNPAIAANLQLLTKELTNTWKNWHQWRGVLRGYNFTKVRFDNLTKNKSNLYLLITKMKYVTYSSQRDQIGQVDFLLQVNINVINVPLHQAYLI